MCEAQLAAAALRLSAHESAEKFPNATKRDGLNVVFDSHTQQDLMFHRIGQCFLWSATVHTQSNATWCSFFFKGNFHSPLLLF